MPSYVALLRGINIGPNKRIAMGELSALLSTAGYGDVRTHLGSGNVLLSSESSPEQLEADLERRIRLRFGFDVAVVVRSREQLADVVARDPLAGAAGDPRRYQVSFLSGELAPDIAAELANTDFGLERVAVSGREIFAWHPEGINDSPLAKLLASRRLGVTATARNWNTVTKLLELAGA